MAKQMSAMEVVYPRAYWRSQAPRQQVAPNVAGWFNQEAMQDVPDRDLGWFLAQGWKVTGSKEDPNNPPQRLYDLQKDALQSQVALRDLINEYTAAYNEGRDANNRRYEDIVVMYNDTILKTHSHLNRAAAANNAHKTLFLTSLSTIINQTDWYLAAMKVGALDSFDAAGDALNVFAAKLTELGSGHGQFVSQIETILGNQNAALGQFKGRADTILAQLAGDFTTHNAAIADLESAAETVAESHIVAYEAKLDEIEAGVDTVESQLLALIGDTEAVNLEYESKALEVLTGMEGDLTGLNADIGSELGKLDAAVASHSATYRGLLALFLADYASHAATTRALLDGLGETERARINEQFDNLLTQTRQNLVDRGFYASALVAQTDARVERERSEALVALADRLAREQVAHEHQLYGEQTGVRDRQLQGEQYLHSLQDAAIKYRAQWSEKLYEQMRALRQTTLGVHDSLRQVFSAFTAQEMAVRERVFGWGQDARRMVAESKQAIYQIREALSRRKADSEFKLADTLRAIRGMRLSIADRELTATLDVNRFAAEAREAIVNQLNAYIQAHADGVSKYAAQTIQNAQFLAGVRQAAIADHIRTRFQYCTGVSDANRQQQQLYQYQIDTRNNLAVGLFEFMERREDTYPDLDKMGNIAMGLGDAGATQVIQP